MVVVVTETGAFAAVDAAEEPEPVENARAVEPRPLDPAVMLAAVIPLVVPVTLEDPVGSRYWYGELGGT